MYSLASFESQMMASLKSAETDQRTAVVLVDPLSTGVIVQQRVFDLGLAVILVWSDRSQPPCRAKHFKNAGHPEEDFVAVVEHTGDLEETVHAVVEVVESENLELISVICGSEFGVLLEDQIADALNEALNTNKLLSSKMPKVALKVDKFQQSEKVRASGLDAVKQMLAKTDDDVKEFLALQQDSFKAVVKPQTGAGSVGVTFCDSPEAVWNAYDGILAGEHKAHCGDKYKHYESMGVLMQEYLQGTEYIVNIVCHNGVRKCTALWKYDKRPYNGAAFVCYAKELLALEDDPRLPEILDYTLNVLESLGFQNGSIHAEIMHVPGRGPILVEINCRLHGGNGAWVHPAEICIGYSQVMAMMDVYLNEGKGLFSTIPVCPVVNGGCFQVKMRSFVTGTLAEVIPSQLQRILDLPSYSEHVFSVKPGDTVLKTVDMASVPGEVTLVNTDKTVLARDYAELNDILHEGIFRVQSPSPIFGKKGLGEVDDVTVATMSSYSDVSTGTGGVAAAMDAPPTIVTPDCANNTYVL
eukprot:Nitzschia sp. Nitz4//scaffold443_size6817//3461//5264//NITZ4_009168-RA/size6817-augustus-gene-0.2-mRNA-1//-1//CDS//3329552042//7668//frame0